ncbi:MAG: hypothetical protein H6844_15700 [Alphaproteobacteria bacterium]|nr:hypothetical protein [Alphaproteobacteria bacterium]
MAKIVLSLIGLAVIAALGGALYIAMGDIPPPTQTIEKTLPNARFER